MNTPYECPPPHRPGRRDLHTESYLGVFDVYQFRNDNRFASPEVVYQQFAPAWTVHFVVPVIVSVLTFMQLAVASWSDWLSMFLFWVQYPGIIFPTSLA